MTKWTLSDDICNSTTIIGMEERLVLDVDNVKEFIKLLKATMLITPSPMEKGEFIKWMAKELDTLAGEELK